MRPGSAGAQMSAASAIRTEALTRDFGPVRAVDTMDLDVPRGAVFGFLGPNGAGKSTAIRLLLGLLEPTSGRALVAGFDPAAQGDEVRARCGVLLDETGLYDRLTAAQNLELYARVWGLAPGERAARVGALLEHIGLADRRGEPVGGWSLGMRKKLATARAMLNRPEVVFLDEPANGLDPMARASLHEDIRGLAAQEGTTVFLTTHDLADAERLCDLVGVVLSGRLVAVGPPGELRAGDDAPRLAIRGRGLDAALAAAMAGSPGVEDATPVAGGIDVRLSAGADAAPLVRLAVERGAEVEEVSREASSLEEAFLALVRDEEGDR